MAAERVGLTKDVTEALGFGILDILSERRGVAPDRGFGHETLEQCPRTSAKAGGIAMLGDPVDMER